MISSKWTKTDSNCVVNVNVDNNQSGVTELLTMRNPHHGRMSFISFKTLEALYSQLCTAGNVELLGLYPRRKAWYLSSSYGGCTVIINTGLSCLDHYN